MNTTVLNLASHGVAAALTLVVIATVFRKMSPTVLFAWHPTLMTLGFAAMMTEGLLLMSKQPLFGKTDRKLRVKLHFLLNTTGAVCTSLGFLAIYINKNYKGKPHFVTWHALVGLIASAWAAMLGAVGWQLLFPEMLKPISKALGGLHKLYRIHGIVGVIGYAVSMLALGLGFMSKWWVGKTEELPILYFATIAGAAFLGVRALVLGFARV
eukprot:m.266079 g.266079  ORF g.266079 m.266079 type:complete len:211 (-) comp30025_c0_seq1:41-673(-)